MPRGRRPRRHTCKPTLPERGVVPSWMPGVRIMTFAFYREVMKRCGTARNTAATKFWRGDGPGSGVTTPTRISDLETRDSGSAYLSLKAELTASQSSSTSTLMLFVHSLELHRFGRCTRIEKLPVAQKG